STRASDASTTAVEGKHPYRHAPRFTRKRQFFTIRRERRFHIWAGACSQAVECDVAKRLWINGHPPDISRSLKRTLKIDRAPRRGPCELEVPTDCLCVRTARSWVAKLTQDFGS